MGKKNIKEIVNEVMETEEPITITEAIVNEIMETEEPITITEELQDIINEVMEVEEPTTEVIVEEIKVPEEEIIEDDELVENKPVNELPKFKMGDAVALVPNAKYTSGSPIPANLFNNKLYVRTVKENGYGIAPQTTGRISGTVAHKDLIKYVENIQTVNNQPENIYLALIKDAEVNIKSRPDENSKTLKTIHRNGLYTVVGEKDDWGHLKIGGWIPMSSYKKIGE